MLTLLSEQAIVDNSEVVQNIESALDEAKETVASPGFFSDLLNSFAASALDWLISIFIAIIVYLIGKRLIKILRALIKRSMEKSQVDSGVVYFVDSLVKILSNIVLWMVIASVFRIEITTFAVLLGSAGVTVGLALQGSLSNFAGGVLLLVLHPFRVGDYIMEHGSGKEGTVSKIEIFYTTLVTGDNKIIKIPNGQLSDCALTNVSAHDKRRLDVTIGIGYDSDLKLAKSLIERILTEEEAAIKDETLAVYVNELAESSVNLGFEVWLDKDNFLAGKRRIMEALKLAFDENGIEIPYRQLDVHINKANTE